MDTPKSDRDPLGPITMARVGFVMVSVLVSLGTGALCPAAAQSPTVTLTSNTPYLAVNQAVAGSTPLPGNDNATRITVVTSLAGRLLASVDAPLPSGVVLRVKVEAPAGAVSMGFVTLDSTPQELVSGISPGNYPGLIVTYEIIASPQAGTVSQASCNVAFTLETGP